MKALEYLSRMLKANQEIGNTPENILECIAELEALQQRSCESCFKNIDVQLCPCHDIRICRDKRIKFCSEHELKEQ